MSRYLNEQYQALQAYVPGEQPRDMEYIKLNTNESPYPPAPSVVAAMTAGETQLLRLYSDPTGLNLKKKLAALYGLEPENIFLANGSDSILNFIFMAYSGKGALFPDLTYGFYTVFAELYGCEYRQIPLNDSFRIEPEDYCSQNKLIVIANPNAPTGLTLELDAIERIVAANPDSVVVVDEAYIDFGGESAYPLIRKYDNLLVVRTYSKSRCLAGGRLGYAFGCPGLIADLEKLKFSTNPYDICRLTLILGEKTVDAEDYYQEKCRQIIATRTFTAKKLKEMGFEVLDSDTNFVFARHPGISGEWLYKELKKRGILVRHFATERIKDFIRITIGTPEQMQVLLQQTEELLCE